MTTYNIYCKDENSFEYVFSACTGLKGVRYQLQRSDASHWTNPGELVLSALDNGNGIKFSEKLGKSLDYAQIAELTIFLNLVRLHDEGLMGEHYVIDADAMQKI